MRKNLTRKERIGKKDISKVFELSESKKNSCIRLLYCRNKITWNRIAVVLRKGYGNSVERNRAKRIIKEIYRELKNSLPEGYDLIFLLTGKITDYQTAKNIIVSLLKKAGLMDVAGKIVQ
ncbi:MAG: ribonuclease P protein component [Spirochaetia bacterium]|jgi:ribonuclease P protein component|nr:ribonuclease P protein component [Spirochaetia bacterium]